ncbi:hypothetical protein [Alteriqipengyuania sp. 357]
MNVRMIGCALAALALMACEGQDDPAGKADAPAQAGRPGEEAGPPASTPASPPASASSAGNAAGSAGYSSHYTPLDLATCTVTDSESEEGQWAERTCPGYRGIPLFVDDGDGRFDIDAGVRNEKFQSLGAFNDPPDTIEWRMKDGVPFAIIYRLTDASPDDVGRTVLMVERIGTAQRPGCTVAQVVGSAQGANARARELGDRTAAGFDCAAGKPEAVGKAR